MHTGYDVCNDFAKRTYDSNSSLAKSHMDLINGERYDGVAGKRTKEYAGNDYGIDTIIGFKLKTG